MLHCSEHFLFLIRKMMQCLQEIEISQTRHCMHATEGNHGFKVVTTLDCHSCPISISVVIKCTQFKLFPYLASSNILTIMFHSYIIFLLNSFQYSCPLDLSFPQLLCLTSRSAQGIRIPLIS